MQHTGKILALALLLAASLSAAVNVTSVQAGQRWPWNGKVDIVYTLSAEDTNGTFNVSFDCLDGTNEVVMTSLSGEGATGSVTGTGTKVLTWDAGTDYAGRFSQAVTFGVTASVAGPTDTYLVFDLATGTSEEVGEAPAEWTTADKTRYLWFRKIPAGTFVMGSPAGEVGHGSMETEHQVTFTRDFYAAVFELTEAQYNYIEGSGETTSDLPKRSLSYIALRGNVKGALFPASTAVDADSIIGRLRARIPGYAFDLPTEAQWEYACKAGTHGTWNDGSAIQSEWGSDSNLDPLDWYGANADGAVKAVGLKAPNAWGLYDTQGNLSETCLDYYADDITAYTLDPLGPTNGTQRAIKGGWSGDQPKFCRPARRLARDITDVSNNYGARLFINADTSYMKIDLTDGTMESNLTRPAAWTEEDKTRYLWLRRIPAGTFVMGSPEEEVGHGYDETEHQVTLTKDFYAGVFALTVGQYDHICDGEYKTVTRVKGGLSYEELRGTETGALFPVNTGVDSTSLLGQLRTLCGGAYAFDLPTEAQWEYACKAGTHGTWNDGSAILETLALDANLEDLGWYACNAEGKPQAVGQKKPNAWGLYDMHGNVDEWCLNWYTGDITEESTDPVGPASGTHRCLRGGAYYDYPRICRAAFRNENAPDSAYESYGFRVFLTVED